MPAFATDNAGDINATDTIDVARLKAGVDRMIADGVNAIATTGSFGELHTLLPGEFETLTRATIEVVAKRVPLFIGCTSLNPREAVRKIRLAQDLGAEGIMVGVPFYLPLTLENAVHFYSEMAQMFPKLAFVAYHNPTLHRVTLEVPAFRELTRHKNIIGMKDSHRDTLTFMELMGVVRDSMTIYTLPSQYFPYCDLGAGGLWSMYAWMGPEPLVALLDAVKRGDREAARRLVLEIPMEGGRNPDMRWRENFVKLTIRAAGYCDPGPLRPPFKEIPPAVLERARATAAEWQAMREKVKKASALQQRRA
jgi:dihydrodipicolinate synthase/N-acetylneuraminate lyase